MNGETVWNQYQKLREANPLVQCITNYVSMDIMANVLLSIGASPAMVRATCGWQWRFATESVI